MTTPLMTPTRLLIVVCCFSLLGVSPALGGASKPKPKPKAEHIKLYNQAYDEIKDLEFSSAQALLERALKLEPDFAEAHNNLAYTLSEHMDKPAEALPLAVRAVELSPMNRGMLDTLGTVYISAGQPENAFEPLERALALATTDAGRVSAMVLLARAQLETGNLPGASDTASDARRLIDRIDEPDEDTQRELDSVLEDIQQRR